ncbi:MAG: hypothetical protein NC935_08275 [Candidatus Omnitrophica bacterium]|nr:hypothetical protein [Candidatus Omnitrophota bacterium]
MTAERADKPGQNSAFSLTSDQAERVSDEMTKKWDGRWGLRLDQGVLEELMKIFGPNAKIGDILKSLREQEKKQ